MMGMVKAWNMYSFLNKSQDNAVASRIYLYILKYDAWNHELKTILLSKDPYYFTATTSLYPYKFTIKD
jgi:hypothetical protein